MGLHIQIYVFIFSYAHSSVQIKERRSRIQIYRNRSAYTDLKCGSGHADSCKQIQECRYTYIDSHIQICVCKRRRTRRPPPHIRHDLPF